MKTRFALALALLTVSSHAAISYSGLQNITIPADFTGVYIDIDTAATGLAPFAGWDINPLFGGTAVANSAVFQPVRVAASNQSAYVNLPFNDLIDSTDTYASGFGGSGQNPNYHFGPNPGQFQDGVDGYLGFKFTTNSALGPYYGWMRLSLTNNTPGALVKDWAYDNTGAGIIAGNTGVAPEPGAALLLLAGCASLLLRRNRAAVLAAAYFCFFGFSVVAAMLVAVSPVAVTRASMPSLSCCTVALAPFTCTTVAVVIL